ncbi:hypothetical protein [Nocardioides xinjiangensis]|uniref:hypothetical protein n=1 Tax=Nocardioides xinjiangensis TaxID=2817376 RepID=UPI001B305D0E|nr:hypothetical protein [Nocardioides sp. SYSU D00514]
MAARDVAIDGASVVVRGNFNPAIFSPRWFLDEELIGSAEFEDSAIEIISPNLTVFRMGWANVHSSSDTFQVNTRDQDEFERLRDLVAGVLRTLRHTPVAVLGLNRDIHIRVPDREALDRIGDRITPKDIWNPTLPLAGLRGVTMWGSRQNQYGGHIQVTVEPSLRVPNAVYVSHNDHYDLSVHDSPPVDRVTAYDEDTDVTATSGKLEVALQVLSESWSQSMTAADEMAGAIESLGRIP